MLSHEYAVWLAAMGIALLVTIAVELAVAAAFGLRTRSMFGFIALINAVTNPILNDLFLADHIYHLFPIHMAGIFFLEAIVVLVEWQLLVVGLEQNSRKMFLLSLAMNAASFAAGFLY